MRRVPFLLYLVFATCGGDSAPEDAQSVPDAEASDAASPDAHTGQTGDPCASAMDCDAPNTVCLQQAMSSGWDVFPGGYCSLTPCVGGQPCGMGGICQPLPGYGPHCFVSCTSDTDCRMAEGYTCQASTLVPPAMLCLPPPT